MQINFPEKQLISELDDFRHRHNAAVAFNHLMSVMFYPDDEKKQGLFLLAQKDEILQEHPQEEHTFLKSSPQLAIELCVADMQKATRVLEKTMHSRQGGGKSSLFIKGSIAGILFQYLIQVGSLEAAYKLYGQFPQRYTDESGRIEPLHPSKATLYNIWSYFLPVVHLWAAYEGFRMLYGTPPIDPALKLQGPSALNVFMSFASSFRDKLVELPDSSRPSCGNSFLVKDSSLVWKILTHRMTPFL